LLYITRQRELTLDLSTIPNFAPTTSTFATSTSISVSGSGNPSQTPIGTSSGTAASASSSGSAVFGNGLLVGFFAVVAAIAVGVGVVT